MPASCLLESTTGGRRQGQCLDGSRPFSEREKLRRVGIDERECLRMLTLPREWERCKKEFYNRFTPSKEKGNVAKITQTYLDRLV